MTRVSRRPLRKELEERMFRIFWQGFVELHSEKDVFEFLEDLLSPAEKVMLAKRLAIAVLLEKNWQYDEISSVLKVSTTTVNAVRQKQAILGRGYKRVVLAILKREEVASFLEDLVVDITSMVAPFGKVGLGPRLRQAARYHQQNRKKNIL